MLYLCIMNQSIIDKLKNHLEYNKDSGVFTWKIDIFTGQHKTRKLISKGDIAGGYMDTGYIYIKLDGIKYQAHRLAYIFTYNRIPLFIDHINIMRDDNRIDNLRECTSKENSGNRKLGKNSTTGYKGVSYYGFIKKTNIRKYIAKIRNETIGVFNDKEEAARAYDKKALELFGEFANLNFKQ